ncbi:hypothetical protein DRO64_11055, partial [Candidatus Bathyarchaeota archaeon]
MWGDYSLGSLQCVNCGKILDYPPVIRCPKCGGLVEYRINIERLKEIDLSGEFSFWRYRPFLPEVKNVASMKEGGTPFYRAK